MKLFLKFFYKSLMTAIMFTSLFLFMNTIDAILVKKGIIGANKLYILAPIQFLLVIFIYMAMMYTIHWFKLM
jgi:hypothetical protein